MASNGRDMATLVDLGTNIRLESRHSLGGQVFEQGALPVLSCLPAQCLIGVLPGDLMFQSDKLDKTHMRPAIFHGYSGSKTQWAGHLRELAAAGMVTLLETLLGTESLPPLWQSQISCQFAVGSSWKVHRAAGVLSEEQTLALPRVWSRDIWTERPNDLCNLGAYEHNPMKGATPPQPHQGQTVQISNRVGSATYMGYL